GGHLMLHGGEIAFGLADAASTDQDKNFLSTQLHATYVRDSAGPRTVHGVANDSVSGSFASSNINIYAKKIDESNGSLNQPDEVRPVGAAIPIFYYGTASSQVGGIRWDSASTKLAYLAFGLQNLADADRAAITSAIFA